MPYQPERIESPELRLLLASARADPDEEDQAEIRRLLAHGMDWTAFVRQALAHGLAGLSGHGLLRAAGDALPTDIAEAFGTVIERSRRHNQILLDHLARVLDALADVGVTAIPFKGPVLALDAFGDLGLRAFRDLDFLIGDRDLAATIGALREFGYRRQGPLTVTQFDVIHRLQGQEILFSEGGPPIEPHTRLTSIKMALPIDYEGLWRRARLATVNGKSMLTFCREDNLLVLAVHGGKELWWDIKWACDIAEYIRAHPGLDWDAAMGRAGPQGCRRTLLVATALARRYLKVKIPQEIVAAEEKDPVVGRLAGRITTGWQKGDLQGPPSNKKLSIGRLLLHEGIAGKMNYGLRTLLLPGPQHIPLLALPRRMAPAYIPIGIAHDAVALPLWRAWRLLRPQNGRLRS